MRQPLLRLVFLPICFCYYSQLFAASAETFWKRTISGTVLDEEGQPIPGVNVLEKETTTGTITDVEGQYNLTVVGDKSVLVFSFIGYQSQEITVGSKSVVDITMDSEAQSLSEVVITALGFEEDADQMGATSAQVEGEAIARSGEAQLINGISGRAAGVNVTRSSGDPGAGSFIQIRGASTITGSSQPLIIVDGIPISNNSQDDSPNVPGNTSGGVVQQSRLNDINPNDIASMQILKGASAAALWGSRAANGVIVITTKKGKLGERMRVSYRSSYSVDQINVLHPKQGKFGQGANGAYSATTSQSWGDKSRIVLAGRMCWIPQGHSLRDISPDNAIILSWNETNELFWKTITMIRFSKTATPGITASA